MARRAIWVESGSKRFLVETDETIAIAADGAAPKRGAKGVPTGMKPVVDLGQALKRFQQAKDMIVHMGTEFADSIEKMPTPSKASIEFGITLAGETGVPMLTKASGEASIKVCIEWAKADQSG
jgi:hypothetical protein